MAAADGRGLVVPPKAKGRSQVALGGGFFSEERTSVRVERQLDVQLVARRSLAMVAAKNSVTTTV